MAGIHYHDDPEIAPVSGLEVVQAEKEVPVHNGMESVPLDRPWNISHDTKPSTRDGRRICGVARSKTCLIIIVALLFLCALAAAITGGVISRLHEQNSYQPSPSTSPSSTSFSTVPSSTGTSSSSISTPTSDAANCPSISNTLYSAQSGARFEQLCNTDLLAPFIDITHTTTATFDACIQLCDTYNLQTVSTSCKGVAWDLYAEKWQYCFLKNSTGHITSGTTTGNNVVSAVLQ